MSWHDVDLTTVSPTEEIIPEKTFTFELLPGAKFDERGTGGINVAVAIVDDGEFTGRRMFAYYPDPESVSVRTGKKQDWSKIAMKRLEQALGIDCQAGEKAVEYLNRVAGNRFSTSVKHSAPTDEYPVPRANLNLLNVKPAA